MPTASDRQSIRRHLPQFTEEEIDACLVLTLQGEHFDQNAAELLAGWAFSVSRFEREAVLAPDDPQAWGADDYIGALFGRDDLAELVREFQEELPPVFHTALSSADDTLRLTTVEDSTGLLQKFQAHESIGTSWWWRRVPRSGPVRHDLTS